jgi:hypothetical protein
MMIDINKQYRTRDGREVRIYATDGEHGELVHGAIKHKEYGWQSMLWFADGHYHDGENSCCDLIEVRPRHKRTVWVNVYGRPDDVTAYNDKWKADQSVSPRIACIKVDLDFEEGEGL